MFLFKKFSLQIGCCGADGPHDFLSLQQPLPTQCRNSITGNPYFHGCVDELTWFFEEKCAWIAALAMTICFIHVSFITSFHKQFLEYNNVYNTQLDSFFFTIGWLADNVGFQQAVLMFLSDWFVCFLPGKKRCILISNI